MSQQVRSSDREVTHRHRAVVLRGVAVLLAALLAGWSASTIAAQPTSKLQGRVPLARLLDLAVERLHLQVTYDEASVKGEVVLRDMEGMSDPELWALANDHLAAGGLTTVRTRPGETLSVVRLQDAGVQARLEPEAPPRMRAGYERRLIEPLHADPQALSTAILKLLSPNGSITVLDQGLLIVADLTVRLEQVERLVAQLDAEAAAPTRQEIRLEHLTPERLLALLTQYTAKRQLAGGRKPPGELLAMPDGRSVLVLAPDRWQDDWARLIRSLDRLEPVETRRYAPKHFALEEVAGLIEQTVRDGAASDGRWKVVVDRLTGSLVITATASDHDRIDALLARLAETPVESRRPVRSYVVRNRNVSEVVEVLTGLIEAGALEAGGLDRSEAIRDAASQRSERPAGEATPEAATPASSQRRDVAAGTPRTENSLTLTADEGTNTLIVVGDPRLQEQIAALLEIIDVRQPQVMLEVLLVSLSEGETRDLGVEIAAIVKDAGTLIRLSSLFGLSEIVPEMMSTAGAGGPGGTAVILDPGDFSAVIRALKTINEGRTLSVPKVLVNNNQDASFDSVLQQPFTSTNASDTVATTSFGGTQDAGTTVSVRPQIAEGDHLVLEYAISLSSFVGESSDPSIPPPRQQNSLTSVATIPDGYTIAVGGIELTTEAEAISKTPLLADIPLVGELFKNRSDSSSWSRFYVFIRASVLRHETFEDLKYLSAADVAGAGVDDGWPEVEPRVIR